MATNFIEEFLVGLGFKFEGDDGEKFQKQTEVIASTINKVTMAAVAASAALYAMAKSTADSNYEQGKTATMLDTSAEALTRWKHAADIAGVGGENVIGMLTNLKAQAQEAVRTGSGPFRAYQDLGVDFEAIASGGQDVTAALEDIVAAAQQMDRQVAKSALRELGIDEKFLDTPIEKLRAAGAEADRWGKTTKNLTDLSTQFAETQSKLGLRLGGVANMLTERMLPGLIEFFETLMTGLEWMQTTGIPIIDEIVEKLGGWEKVMAGMALVALPGLIGALGKVLSLVTGIAGGAAGAGGALAMLFRGGALGVAGYAGWEAGTAINDALPQEVQDAIGEYLTKTLAFVGVKSAQDAVEAMEGERFPSVADKFAEARDMQMERYYAEHPNERPKTGRHSSNVTGPNVGGKVPTMEEWLAAPYDPSAPMPEFPAATNPFEGPATGPVTEEDMNRIVPPRGPNDGPGAKVINNNQTVTNNYNGVPLSEVDEIFQRNEQEESQYLQNENINPVVR